MKITLALLVALVAAPAFANDGSVPQSTLDTLGLESIQEISDTEAMDVRGRSSSASASGISLLFAALLDPANPGNFLVGTDLNGGNATSENAGLQILSTATQGPQGSSIAGLLDISTGSPAIRTFLGSFAANAGNASNIGNAGFSFGSAQ